MKARRSGPIPLMRAGSLEPALLKFAVDSAFDVILILDAEHLDENGLPRIVFASAGVEQQTGFRPEELIGRSPNVFYGPKTDRATIATLQHVSRTLEPISAEMLNYRKDGSEFWVETNSRPIADSEGKTAYWITVRRDITRRKFVEEALRGSEERYRLLFDSNPNPMWVMDRETLQFLAVNDAAVEHYGYSRQQFLGMTVLDIQPPEDRERVKSFLATLGADPPPVVGKHRKRDGTPIDVSIDRRNISWLGRRARLVCATDITEKLSAENSLRETAKTLELMVSQLPAVIFTTDRNLKILSHEGKAQANIGVARNQNVGRDIRDVINAMDPDYGDTDAFVRAVEGHSSSFERQFAGRTWQTHVEPMRDASGAIVGTIGLALDITEQRKAESALRETETRLELAASQLPAIFWTTDPNLVLTSRWGSALAAVAEAQNSHIGLSLFEHLETADANHPSIVAHKRALLGESVTFEAGRKDRFYHAHVEPWRDARGEIAGVIGIALDVTESYQSSERIAHLAHYDALTELPNRTLVDDRLKQALAHAHRRQRHVAVLALDINNFKHVGETLGRAAADDLLKSVARRLSERLRAGDTLARVADNEFVVALADMTRTEDAVTVAQAYLESLKAPFEVAGRELFVRAGLGISLFPEDAVEPDELIQKAESAMSEAKKRGENAFQLFTPALQQSALERLSIENELRRAIERKEFVVHYQPIVNVADRVIVGVEALVRWQHPTRGLIQPSEFIPIAEETGTIIGLGDLVLSEACNQIKRWENDGLRPPRVAVNISPRQFAQENFASSIAQMLKDSRVKSEMLELEITEGVVVKDVEAARRTFNDLKATGVRLALDDFGTGYSALGYLKRFPFDTIKIDRSFVTDIATDPFDEAIAASVVALGRTLDLVVTAEGVESEKQMAVIRDLRCQEAQGYLFSRPVPASELAALLHSGKSLVAAN